MALLLPPECCSLVVFHTPASKISTVKGKCYRALTNGTVVHESLQVCTMLLLEDSDLANAALRICVIAAWCHLCSVNLVAEQINCNLSALMKL